MKGFRKLATGGTTLALGLLLFSTGCSSSVPQPSASSIPTQLPPASPVELHSQTPETVEEAEEVTAPENWILDPYFDNGVMVLNPIPGTLRVSGKLDIGKEIGGKVASWTLSQWSSKSNIFTAQGRREDDTILYENDQKKFAVADDGTVTLKVNMEAENVKPRRKMDPWVHLYLGQRYKEPNRLNEDPLRIAFKTRITESVNLMAPEDYDTNIHSAIAVFYLVLTDLEGSGQYINFCVPIYDNRLDIPSGSWHIDSGMNVVGDTHQLIYTLDGEHLYSSPTGDGQWHAVDVDLKPYVEEALEIAKQNRMLEEAAYEDLWLTSIEIGWEVPGVFRSEMQIKDMTISNKARE